MPNTISLDQVPLFQGLDDPQLQSLRNISQKLFYQKNQAIFSQDDPAKGFYVVLSGQVKVYKLSLEGKEQVLHIFGSGEPVGEVPVFAGDTFPAHAQAIYKSELLFFPRQRLRELFLEDPSLAMNMLAVLSRRLRTFTSMIEDLSLKELPQRLAAYILHLMEKQENDREITLDVSKGMLSKILGASQETLSRVFKQMTDSGLIQMDKKTIRILDPDALEDFAEGLQG